MLINRKTWYFFQTLYKARNFQSSLADFSFLNTYVNYILIHIVDFFPFHIIRRKPKIKRSVVKNYIGTQGEDLSTVKVLLKTPVVYATLPAVLRRWSLCYSYFVWVCGLYDGAFYVQFYLAFSFLFSTVITSLGKRELAYIVLVHLFVYFARVNFCPFSLPLGVEVWLRFVIVALPGLFY